MVNYIIIIYYYFHFQIDCKVIGNRLNSVVNREFGYGCINFYGNELVINGSFFSKNENYRGSCLIIDNYVADEDAKINLTYVIFEGNIAEENSAGFLLGKLSLTIQVFIDHLYCFNNEAFCNFI